MVTSLRRRFERVAEPLGALAFGLLSEKLDVAQFTDVAHVRSSTRTHVHPVANLYDPERRNAGW